jgi:hypothetical protein
MWATAHRTVNLAGVPTEAWNEQGEQQRFQKYALLLVLRQEPA